jgi:hypothetical protein
MQRPNEPSESKRVEKNGLKERQKGEEIGWNWCIHEQASQKPIVKSWCLGPNLSWNCAQFWTNKCMPTPTSKGGHRNVKRGDLSRIPLSCSLCRCLASEAGMCIHLPGCIILGCTRVAGGPGAARFIHVPVHHMPNDIVVVESWASRPRKHSGSPGKPKSF